MTEQNPQSPALPNVSDILTKAKQNGAALPETCDKCKFARAVFGNPHLECRAHPPHIMLLSRDARGNPLFISNFPSVQRSHWCAEFQRKVEVAG